jgi:hypothetical protein
MSYLKCELETSYETINDNDFIVYNFSDNQYLIKVSIKHINTTEKRIKNFFSKKTRDLIFSDLSDTYFIKK